MDQTVSIPLEPEVEVLQVSEFFFNAVNDEVPNRFLYALEDSQRLIEIMLMQHGVQQ